MKMDQDYSYVLRCPVTKEQLSFSETCNSNGVCPRCGHDADSTYTHEQKEVGRWNKANIWEKIRGKRDEWLPKSEEDTVMNALKGK